MTHAAAWKLPVAAAVGSLVVSLPRVAVRSTWWDEAATRSAIDRPWSELWDLLGHVDRVHAAYYAVAKIWSAAIGSTSVVSLRVLSALVLAIGAAGFVVLLHDVSGPRVARAGAVVFTLSPAVAGTALDARSQAFAITLVVWTLVVLRRVTTRGGRWWWVVLAGLFVVTPVFHLMTVLMAPVHVACAWVWGRFRPVLLVQLAAGLVLGPFVLAAQRQSGQVAWIDVSPAGIARQVFLEQVVAGAGTTYDVLVVAGCVLGGLVLTALGVLALTDGRRVVDARLALVWLVVPTVALALPSVLGADLYLSRYVVFTAPAACWLLALGWLRARGAVTRSVVLVTAAASLVVLSTASVEPRGGWDYRALARLAEGADAVVFASDDARGIAVAYPADFTGVDDLLIDERPIESDTLFGTSRPIASMRPAGRVVVYAYEETSGRPVEQERALQELRGAGCVRTARSTYSGWDASTYECPSAAG